MQCSRCTQGICDSKVCLPELLEHVSAGQVLEADSNLSRCINFTVFSFVMAHNNKNVGGLFGCNFTFCVKTSTFDSTNSLYLKIFEFIRYDFRCFGDKDSFSIPLTEEFVFFDFKVHKK